MAKVLNGLKGLKSKHYINYVIVILAVVVACILNFTGSCLKMSTANLLTQIGYSIILAVSLNVVVGFLGELSLGHAGFMCIGAYIGGFVAKILIQNIPSKAVVLILTMIIGGLLAGFFGFVIGLPSLRLKGDYLAIVTLAFGEIVRNIFKNLKVFGGALGLGTGTITYDTRRSVPTLFIVTFVVVLIMLALIQNLMRSKHGRAITAIRDNEIAAKAMGINVTFYKLFAFVVSAFFAGVAGVIYSHHIPQILYSKFDYNYSIEILVMVVLGGMGNITGSIVAASAITCVNFYLQKYLSGELAALKFLIYAIILIVVVVFGNAPKLAGLRARIKEMFRSKHFNPAKIKSDEAAWDRIPTKIKMDAILSNDLNPNQFEPVKPQKQNKTKDMEDK